MTPPDKPESLCMAPWVHTYLSPITERRMCCASREPAQNFQQYIDTKSGSNQYQPLTLEEHWNSEHMRDVRRRMMAGNTMPECDVCNNKLLNTDVYRDYFWHLFKHKYNDIWSSTDETGYTTMKPISWDYRFSNLCNFKCRMCGDMLSSSWEAEQRQYNMVDYSNPNNNWMIPDVRREITQFQDTQIEQEFSQAVEEHRIEEVYWVGGEPLMFEQHWRYMQRIIELGDGKHVYARYNTNLSRINYRGINLYTDILDHLRDWQICASIDGTGEIGEYVRTGLDYQNWLRNFSQGVEHQQHPRQMRVDFTLTLPGMFETDAIQQMANNLGVDILAKTVFAFSPDIFMSPLILPRRLLEPWIDELLETAVGSIKDVLLQLRSRPTFEEQWPEQYPAGVVKGKNRILQLESMRPCTTDMDRILSQRPKVYEWWKNIS
jgi:hypothetical protein